MPPPFSLGCGRDGLQPGFAPNGPRGCVGNAEGAAWEQRSRQQMLRALDTLTKGRGEDAGPGLAGPQDIVQCEMACPVIHSFIHSFNKHELDTSYVLGTQILKKKK